MGGRIRASWIALCIIVVCSAGVVRPRPLAAAAPADPTVTGREQIGWDVALQSDDDRISNYTFVVAVDGVRRTMSGVRCDEREADAADCSAPLPSLTLGRHVLQMIAVRLGLESVRSAALVVNRVVEPTLAGQVESAGVSERWSNTEPPSDLAILPDGRVLVAERDGRVRVGGVKDTTLVNALVLADVDSTDGSGLFSIALHPDFARNGQIYLAYAATTPASTRVYRLVRAHLNGDTIGDVAVLVDDVPAGEQGWAIVRFGPDQKLYVAFGESPTTAGRNDHPYNNAIVRLEDDGTTPRDSRAASPVHAERIGTPRGLAWTEDNALWVVALDPRGAARLQHVGDGVSYSLAAGARPGGLAAMRAGGAVPQLWIGRLDGAGVQIVTLEQRQNEAGTLVQRARGRIGCVVPTADGSALLCAANPRLSGLASRVERLGGR